MKYTIRQIFPDGSSIDKSKRCYIEPDWTIIELSCPYGGEYEREKIYWTFVVTYITNDGQEIIETIYQ